MPRVLKYLRLGFFPVHNSHDVLCSKPKKNPIGGIACCIYNFYPKLHKGIMHMNHYPSHFLQHYVLSFNRLHYVEDF